MQFRKYIGFESKYLLSWRFIAALLVFFIVCGYFVHYGLSQFKHNIQEKENFQGFETAKLSIFVYLSQYGDYGLRLLFVPSSLMAFFDGGPVPTLMTAFIDTSERMKIYQPLKSQNAFTRFNNLFMNFGGFILLFGSTLALFYGYDAFRRHAWLKFLESNLKSRKKLYFYLVASRIAILLLICLLLGALSVLLFIIMGVSVDVGQVLAYSLGFFVLLLYFLVIGFCGGASQSQFKGGASMVVSWFLLAFIIPMLICQWTFNGAAKIESAYSMEGRKLKGFMDYEKTSFEEEGRFDASKRGSQKEKDMFMAFWNSGFKRIMEEEKKMLNEIKDHISYYQTMAALFPSTFFLSFSGEMSSRGFSSMVGFNEYAQEVKKNFFWFRAENYIFSDKKAFQPFFKGVNDNIFQGKSQLPDNFGFGSVFTVLWLAVLFLFSWIRFSRMLDHARETKRELSPDELKKDKTNIMFTSDKGLLFQLINKLRSQNIPFLSVPVPASLPGDTKVKNLFSLFGLVVPEALKEIAGKYVFTLELDQKGRVLAEITRSLKTDVLVFDNFLAGLSDDIINHFASVLNSLKKGRIVVYFTNSLMVTTLICDCGLKWTDEKIAF
ncbi:MAG: hypothetical protein PVH61_07780 [Candidatus Aminicenantes bacterium]|jgi:hypothetical protein